jgi:parallel beta-helix repeat protein
LISGNNVRNNGDNGIYLESSINNTFTENEIGNNNVGVNVASESENNLFFYNYFLNKIGVHAQDSSLNNSWNSSIIGNYWDDYTGSDLNFDGIGDDPYNISGPTGSKDYLPIWDNSAPNITINSPNPGDVFGFDAPNFVVMIKEAYLDTMWYIIEGIATNFTFTTNNTIDQTSWNALTDGNVTLTFYANDSIGNTNFKDVIVIKDTIAPRINVITPTENENFNTSAPDFMVEIKDPHLDTMWYTLDGIATKFIFTQNDTIDQTTWDALADGSVIITFYANDTAGNSAFKDISVIKNTSSQSGQPGQPGLDPTTTIIIIIASIIGGIGAIGVILGILVKKGRISFTKPSFTKPSFRFRQKTPTEKTPDET